MARRRSYPEGLPAWLEADPGWDEPGSERYSGRGVELVAFADAAAQKSYGSPTRFLLAGGVRGESADIHAETDDWEEALELIGLNEVRPLPTT